MSLQTDSITAALLFAGLSPELSRSVLDCTVSPTSGSAGYDVGGAAVGTVHVGVRRAGPGRQVDIRVTTVDLTATYTATIAGTNVAYDAAAAAPADVEELVTEWAAAITADGTVGSAGSAYQTVATAVDSTGSGTVDTVRIMGQTPASWSFAATDTGTAALSVDLDPESCTVDVYERRVVASVATRIAAMTTAPGDTAANRTAMQAQLDGWRRMQGATGDAQLLITDGQSRDVPIMCAGATSVRPYIHTIVGVAGDAATAGSVTVTLRDPVAIVTYGRVSG